MVTYSCESGGGLATHSECNGQYGATGFRVALTAGVSKEKGDYLVDSYWKKNWAIKAVADDCIVKQCGGYKWLWNPVSRFWYWLKVEKDRFSTLCQGTGVYCFDTWIKHVRSKRPSITAQFHDEGVWTLKKGYRDKCESLLRWAVEETNKQLQLNRRLDIDVQFGDSYAEIH